MRICQISKRLQQVVSPKQGCVNRNARGSFSTLSSSDSARASSDLFGNFFDGLFAPEPRYPKVVSNLFDCLLDRIRYSCEERVSSHHCALKSTLSHFMCS